ncbi:MAG: TonB-dependent receptor [Xanthomonadaceae bacterium]|jgi:iron complex outermembrane receptor protein|nr:TonB-dependent receptor [Xanthomonadaceae bacterium]
MNTTRLRHLRLHAPHRLTIALIPALLASASIEAHEPADLPALTVTATPLQSDAESLARPVEVLYGEQLDIAKSATLGDTVSKLTGVQSSYFGPGVGRPIIRGQEGPRVQILSNGIGTMDVSTVSADHATSIEPFLADQIEVLKGPATLLFGSGAIGGAINIVDGRIARNIPDRPLSGRAEIRGNTVNNEKTGMFRLDGVTGNWVLHVDGLIRNTDDYDIPGYSLTRALRSEENRPWNRNRLDNSSIKTRAGAVGASWLGTGGNFGLAVSTYRSNYGIPGGAHLHSDDDHGYDHDHDREYADEDRVRIDLVQNRIDLKAGLRDPAAWLKDINLRMGYADYEHVELEDGLAATRFTNQGIEGRLEAVQQEIGGWHGAFGLQFAHSDFKAKGSEAFVPDTKTRNIGLFVLQDRQFGPLKLELGGRYDHINLKPPAHFRDRNFNALSLSAAGIWHLNDNVKLRAGLDRSERAPTNEELYSAGIHVATRSLEIGNPRLDTERGQRAEIGLHRHTSYADFKFSVYRTQFKDFIYLADTGIEADALPVRLWTQQDAVFQGAEAEAIFHLADSAQAGRWDLRVYGDYVQAKLNGNGVRHIDVPVPHGNHQHDHHVTLSNSGYLPRIAPARFGADLSWELSGFRASLGAIRYQKQNDLAPHERPSPGYTLIDAHLAYQWGRGPDHRWEIFLNGNNLTNRAARPHTSLLRDYVPLPGRAVAFGVRAFF